jgi:multidrug transporter EmrE-like cation transporter
MSWIDWPLTARIGISTALFAAGGAYLKFYADGHQPWHLSVSLSAYVVGCFIFADVLRHGLGFGMVIAAMLELSAMVIVGALLFNERIAFPQYTGLACAVSAMILFSLPQNTG